MKPTPIASIGQFGLIDRIANSVKSHNSSTVSGIGDDAAVMDCGDRYMLLSTQLMVEGIDFDLTYFPLKHLGYKALVGAVSNIAAMNGVARQASVAIALSSKFSVESVDSLYEGINQAADDYSVDIVGGDLSASVTGMTICVTVVGEVAKESIVRRNGAREGDLVCLTGDLGGAYMGLHLLEREKRALEGHPNPQPRFEGYEYLLSRWLRPEPRTDVVAALAASKIVPTSMIDISDGLASDAMQICKSSGCGIRLYMDRIPIAQQTHRMAEELNADPVQAALNGGGDYELLFTVPVSMRGEVEHIGGIDLVGYITKADNGKILVAPDSTEIQLRAQGFDIETDARDECSDAPD